MFKIAPLKRHMLLLAVLLCCTMTAFTQAPNAYISSHLQEILDNAKPGQEGGGAIMRITVPGKWTWAGSTGNGIAGMTAGQDQTIAAPTDKYRVGSVSKLFTSMAILQCEENGLLSINETIDTYLRPSLVADTMSYAHLTTIKQLLNHTSGIPEAANNGGCNLNTLDNLTEPASYEYGIACASTQPYSYPGNSFFYSNTNYTIAAMILEAATGIAFETYITDSIITPLGLTETGFEDDQIEGPHMGCYWWLFGFNFYDMTMVDPTIYRGWASVVSTTSDMISFHQAVDDRALLTDDSWNKILAKAQPNTNYGLGYEYGSLQGNAYNGHSGEVGNTTGWFHMDGGTEECGYYINYNFNYQGVDFTSLIDEPVLNFLSQCPTAVNEVTGPSLSVSAAFPNPAQHELTITYTAYEASSVSLTIYDSRGNLVLDQFTDNPRLGINKFELDLGALNSGIYFYHIKNETDLVKERFIVIK